MPKKPYSAIAAVGEYYLAPASPLDGVKFLFSDSDTKGRMMHLFIKKEKKRLLLTENQPRKPTSPSGDSNPASIIHKPKSRNRNS